MTQCETGRSMVEMLGVLAVMGILSVAGIAAYKNAMNKHRANELMYEASKRATVVAMQTAAGRTDLSIREFDNNATLHFSDTVSHDTTNRQFTLEITPVDKAVCQQMKNMKGDKIRKFAPATCTDGATVQLTYNDDMSTTAKASDFDTQAECQSPFKWCSGAETPHCADDCCAGFVESDCQTACDSDTGEVTNAGSETTCDYTTEGAADGLCNGNGVCEEKIEGRACSDNTQCGGVNSGYFCNYNGNVDCRNGPSGQAGTCEVREFGSLYSAGKYDFNGHFRSSMPLDWYSAQNFCQSYNNGRLLSLSELELGDAPLPEGEDYCCGYAGSGSYYASCNFTGKEINHVLKKYGRNYSSWTADVVHDDYFCYAFAVYRGSPFCIEALYRGDFSDYDYEYPPHAFCYWSE